jgi:hypothetical protein
MDLTTLTKATEVISQGGFLLVLVAMVWAGYKQKWVWGHQLTDMEEDRDYWRGLYHTKVQELETDYRKLLAAALVAREKNKVRHDGEAS